MESTGGTQGLVVNCPFTNAGTLATSGTGKLVIGKDLVNDGSIQAGGTLLQIVGVVTGKGTATIQGGGTLELGAGDAQTVTFSGAGGTLRLDRPSSFTGTLAGLTTGDAVDLVGTAATSAALKGSDQLVVANGTATAATFDIGGAVGGLTFTVKSDGAGGSIVTVAAAPTEPPVTTVPATLKANGGSATKLLGVSVADGTTEAITVILSDKVGLLSATPTGGGAATGSGTTKLTLSGSLAQVNAELATVAYAKPTGSTATSDSIDVATSAGSGSNDHQTAVTIGAGTANQPPVTKVPASLTVTSGKAAALSGFSVSDVDAVSAKETIIVVLSTSAASSRLRRRAAATSPVPARTL